MSQKYNPLVVEITIAPNSPTATLIRTACVLLRKADQSGRCQLIVVQLLLGKARHLLSSIVTWLQNTVYLYIRNGNIKHFKKWKIKVNNKVLVLNFMSLTGSSSIASCFSGKFALILEFTHAQHCSHSESTALC